VAKYPADQKQSAVMACLAIVQQEQGWVSIESENQMADYLRMAPIAVHEVTTFYNMYNQQPLGKYKLNVCTNLPCQLRDGQMALQHLCKSLAWKWAAPRPMACSLCSKANAWAPAPIRR
jgi:NADH-quinone oxidoreductase subunit E